VSSLEETRSELEAALAGFREDRFHVYQRLGVSEFSRSVGALG
jgi:hypothetical protein